MLFQQLDSEQSAEPAGAKKRPPTLALAGLGSAVVGLFALPVVFSSIGIILGIAAGKDRGGAGWGAILVGAGGLAYYVLSSCRHAGAA